MANKTQLTLVCSIILTNSVIAAILFNSAAIADTHINITGDTTWSETMVIDSDILVYEGATLVIQPGTEVIFNGSYNLTIKGNVIAVGTSDSPIVFKTNLPSSVNYWREISLEGSEHNNYGRDSIFTHCKFMGYHSNISSGSRITLSKSAPRIENNYIEKTYLLLDGSTALIEENDLILHPSIFNNTIVSVHSNAIISYNMSPHILNNSIEGTMRGSGIYISFSYQDTLIKNNNIRNYSRYGIEIFDCNISLANNTIISHDDAMGQILKSNSLRLTFKDKSGHSTQMDSIEVRDVEGNIYNNQGASGLQTMLYYSFILPEYEISNDGSFIDYNPYTITATKGSFHISETIDMHSNTVLQLDVPVQNSYFVLIASIIIVIVSCAVVGVLLNRRKK